MANKTWNVVVNRGIGIDLGQVHEQNEELARCAALSKYGIAEDEPYETEEALRGPRGILQDDDFSVFPA